MAEHPNGGSAFAQILFSQKSALDFHEALELSVEAGAKVLLLYGREDPWVIPFWGQRAYAVAPKADYFQVSPSGHCPHYETPKAVNEAMLRWLAAQEVAGAKGGNLFRLSLLQAKALYLAHLIAQRAPHICEGPIGDARLEQWTASGALALRRENLISFYIVH